MIPTNILKRLGAHLDKDDKYIYLGHFKAGFTSARNYALRERSIRPESGKYKTKIYTREQYDNLLKFTIVRNPYDRVLSAFFFLQKGNQGPKIKQGTDFKKWVKEVFKQRGPAFNQHFKRMYPRMVFNGEVWLDYIAKLENIKEDWKYIANKCDLDPVFPHKNFRKKKYNRYDYYDDECIEIIYNIYKEDIDKLGYEY